MSPVPPAAKSLFFLAFRTPILSKLYHVEAKNGSKKSIYCLVIKFSGRLEGKYFMRAQTCKFPGDYKGEKLNR